MSEPGSKPIAEPASAPKHGAGAEKLGDFTTSLRVLLRPDRSQED
ncbi:MAG TPA: hypothetical protein VF860_09085 [Candidatus Acidoferrales bacterium]